MRWPLPVIIVVLGLSLSCSSTPSNQNDNNNNNDPSSTNASSVSDKKRENYSVVFTIPVGEGGVNYANVGEEESEPWGPGGLTIQDDGTFLIVDTVADRILKYGSDGSRLATITLKDVVGITDVTADDGNIYVLDQAATVPEILHLSSQGDLLERHPLHSQMLARGLTGLAMSQDRAVLLEFDNGLSTRSFDNRRALDRSLRGNSYAVNVPSLQSQLSEGGRGFVLLNNQRFAEIELPNLLAGLKILRVKANGDVFVLVDEIVPTPEVNLDETIRRFKSDGTLTGFARVPIHDMNTYVENNVAVDNEGQAFATLSGKDNFKVVKLTFENQLEPILAKSPFMPSAATPSGGCNRTRAQMIATAKEYINNRVFLNVSNLNGDCPGRGKPRYLGTTAGIYRSVAYDWGGGAGVDTYNQHMLQNKAAGDVDTHNEEDCSSGVDCSGFVTRCWGFNQSIKYSTWDLPKHSGEISIVELQPGDILNRPGNHVVLFDRFPEGSNSGNGVMDWESTKTKKFDRVVYMRSSWRRLMGYVARRYEHVC